ncbi:MAG: hypothetical protein IJU62_04290 [Muribaculaceae bacterium]|nr:hypothetical protein [Muribaculaceae bacterium]
MTRLSFILLFIISLLGLTCNASDIEQRAQAGDASAQYLLACNYILSQPSDYAAALNWLRQSSKLSYEPATALLNKLTSNGKDRWGNFDLYSFFVYHDIDEDKLEQATIYASRGHSIASLLVARYYIYMQPDYTSAVSYLKKALSDYKTIPEKDDSIDFDGYVNEMSPITSVHEKTLTIL